MRAAQGVAGDVKMAASDVLVALARSHFHFVMSELQSHLKAMGKVPDEIVLLTLGKMAHSYALQCIPFVGMTLLALRAVLSRVGSGRILCAVCSVLEQWSKGVNTYFGNREQCSFPRKGAAARFSEAIYPVFCSVVENWLDCREEEAKQAVLGAVAAMMSVLLREEQHREHAWEQLLWLLHQYREVRDTSRVTKSLSYVLETLEGVQTPVPRGTALAISTAAHRQLSDVTKEPGPAHKAVLSRCVVLQAQMYAEETVAFLRSQLSGGSEAGRVAAVGLLAVLVRSDAPATREKLPQVVEAVGSVCDDPSAQVRRAVLEFIRELLSSVCQSCWAWDVVGHIFTEFSRTSGRLVAGGLFPWETQEDGALQALCMDILGSLDVSLRGMTRLLWPRLLQYVVPAQYSGMLVPLSHCLQALVERRERAGCKEEEEETDATESQEQGRSPSECCWVWQGVGPVRVSLCPTSPEQEPRKPKGRARLCCWAWGALPYIAPCPAQRLVSPARSTLLASAVAALLLSALSPVWVIGAQLPAPQALLARLLVVAAAPYRSGERAVAALRLLQALHGRIHRALGAVWATEVPLLLQYLEGRTESSLDSAEWEHRVLKFLRASLEPIEDKAWTVGLSQELSQQLGSSAPSSWEKPFLHKALGTALAGCQDLRHVQRQVLRFLQETNPVELSEVQGMISVVAHAAENHFHLVLDTVTMFSAALTRDWFYQTSMGWKVKDPGFCLPFLFLAFFPLLRLQQANCGSQQCVGCWLHFLPIATQEAKLRDGNSSRPWSSQLSEQLGELLGGAQGNKELVKVRQQHTMERAQATCAVLMRTYSGIARHAPKEQLLSRVDKGIMGNILRLSTAKQRALQLKLALVQSITEVSCAIQAVGDCGSFELSLKQEATRTLLGPSCGAFGGPWGSVCPGLVAEPVPRGGGRAVPRPCPLPTLCLCSWDLQDWIKREPCDSLVYGVFQALEELSKLRPPLSREESRKLLSVCCQSVLSCPSKARMNRGRKTVRAAVNMQLLHRRGLEDLGHLMGTLLEAEETSACFDDMVHVLKGWLTSAKEWERERALHVCAHVLGACKERFELMVSRDPSACPGAPFPR
ncbi:maestro heat-like repeat-containing protein family member 2B [Phalacrocorax aristotelis]|uniref:maestro heat-like repeat-containing protein family member 2B n=1 Tax=Phalacrocorax aristotelis TaxID=126867 RepID=UPI003F4BFBBE